MSQRSRKYKRIEALFSKGQPAAPDSPLRAAGKTPAPGTPSEDLTVGVEDTLPESVSPPVAASPDRGREDFINDFDRGQKTGFTYDQGEVTSLEKTPLPLREKTMFVPLVVSGKMIGTIQGGGNEADWTAQEIEIVSAVAAQLAQHLEKLGLVKR